MQERGGGIVHMQAGSHRLSFEHDEHPVLQRAPREVVDEEIEPHPRRHAEERRHAKADRVRSLAERPLR